MIKSCQQNKQIKDIIRNPARDIYFFQVIFNVVFLYMILYILNKIDWSVCSATADKNNLALHNKLSKTHINILFWCSLISIIINTFLLIQDYVWNYYYVYFVILLISIIGLITAIDALIQTKKANNNECNSKVFNSYKRDYRLFFVLFLTFYMVQLVFCFIIISDSRCDYISFFFTHIYSNITGFISVHILGRKTSQQTIRISPTIQKRVTFKTTPRYIV